MNALAKSLKKALSAHIAPKDLDEVNALVIGQVEEALRNALGLSGEVAPAAPAPAKRRKVTGTATAEVVSEDAPAKPKRKRATKAEMEARRAAEAEAAEGKTKARRKKKAIPEDLLEDDGGDDEGLFD
jgi:hypothetical protein